MSCYLWLPHPQSLLGPRCFWDLQLGSVSHCFISQWVMSQPISHGLLDSVCLSTLANCISAESMFFLTLCSLSCAFRRPLGACSLPWHQRTTNCLGHRVWNWKVNTPEASQTWVVSRTVSHAVYHRIMSCVRPGDMGWWVTATYRRSSQLLSYFSPQPQRWPHRTSR